MGNPERISTIEGKFGVEHLFAAIFQESGAFLVAKEVVGEGQRGGGGTGRMWSRIALRAGWVTERARSRAYRVSSPRWRERCSRAEYSCRSSVACWPASRSFLYTTSILFFLFSVTESAVVSRVLPILSNSSQKLVVKNCTIISNLVYVIDSLNFCKNLSLSNLLFTLWKFYYYFKIIRRSLIVLVEYNSIHISIFKNWKESKLKRIKKLELINN